MKQIVLALLVLLVLCSCRNQFDQTAWFDEPDQRSGMVEDLIHTYELIGMTENGIIQLLGKPEHKQDEPARQFVYYLGRAGLGVDDRLLRLDFNANGEVEHHEITHD
ncbi:hypothetical protein ACFFSY_01190 [Paenibacillus aurantiacus]|uniref:Uncharacterized protein n=1 Tax=Paenibacillus aurantiacus TaxID=1936118 RepID=A0ABV5KJK6_9BACL